jgi:hypothetical protein
MAMAPAAGPRRAPAVPRMAGPHTPVRSPKRPGSPEGVARRVGCAARLVSALANQEPLPATQALSTF